LKAWKEAEALVADSDYTMFLEEPYASFLDRDSKEELRTLADYCDRLECYTASWDTSDVKKQNAYLDRMVDQGMLEAVPKNEPTATLEQVVGPCRPSRSPRQLLGRTGPIRAGDAAASRPCCPPRASSPSCSRGGSSATQPGSFPGSGRCCAPSPSSSPAPSS